jgi:phosphate transport system substrate-binding protein
MIGLAWIVLSSSCTVTTATPTMVLPTETPQPLATDTPVPTITPTVMPVPPEGSVQYILEQFRGCFSENKCKEFKVVDAYKFVSSTRYEEEWCVATVMSRYNYFGQSEPFWKDVHEWFWLARNGDKWYQTHTLLQYTPVNCEWAKSVTPEPTFTPTPSAAQVAAILRARNYPQVDGSTSTHPLQMVIACKRLGVPCIWGYSIEGEKRIFPDPKYTESPQLAEAMINGIKHEGTNQSYVNLIKGKADLILVARPPSEDELEIAQENKVALDVRAIALDAFVFLVNANNPVENITVENARMIYAGKITDWTELGGSKGQIRAFQRDRNSGSQELMEALVMKGTPMIEAQGMDMIINMGGMINVVSFEPLGIGYSVYYYVTFMLPDENVKLLNVNGVKPTADSIAKRAYPLTTEVYAATRKGTPKDSAAMQLLDWLYTPEGKAAIKESGYVLLP